MTIIQCAKYPPSSGFFLNKKCEKKGEIYQEIVLWSQNWHCLRNFPSHSDLRRSPLPQKRLVYRFNKARKVAGNWRWVCKIVVKHSRQQHPKEAEGMNPGTRQPQSPLPARNGNKPPMAAELGNDPAEEVAPWSHGCGLPATDARDAWCDCVATHSKESGTRALSQAPPLAVVMP